MEKSKLRDAVYAIVKNTWVNRRYIDPINEQTDAITNELWKLIFDENPYCIYCGQFKRMPGTGMQVQLCMCGTEPMKGKELEVLQKTAKRLLSDKPTRLRK